MTHYDDDGHEVNALRERCHYWMTAAEEYRKMWEEVIYRASDSESHCKALSEDVSRLKRDIEFAQCGLEDLNEVIDGLQGKSKAFDEIRTIIYRGKIDNADQAWDRLEDIVWVVNEVAEDGRH